MTRQSKQRIFIVLGILVLVATIAIVYFGPDAVVNRGGDVEVLTLTEDELRKVAQLRNLGLAQMENHQWRESTATFQSMIEIVPESRLAHSHLAIAQTSHFLSIDANADRGELEQAEADALDSIQKLRELAPDSPLSYRLEARLLEKKSQTDQAIQLLQKATELSPEDPTLWYEISRVSQSSRDPETLSARQDALNHLYELVPQNVFAFMQWMDATLQDGNDQLPEIVTQLEDLLAPLADGIEKRNRYNVMDFIDAAKQLIEQDKLDLAKNRLIPIKNIVTGDDVSRTDRQRLDQDLLEFVEFHFDEPLQKQLNDLPMRKQDEAISVSFDVGNATAELNGTVKYMEFADLTLDGQQEMILLLEDRIEVFSRSKLENGQAKNFKFALDSTTAQFVLADLDYDLKDIQKDDEDGIKPQHTADLDMICFGPDGLQIYRNTLEQIGGEPRFEIVKSNLAELDLVDTTHVVPADLNNDGDLDLAVISSGTLYYLNNVGDFQFEKVPLPEQAEESNIKQCLALDFDRDIDIDLLVLMEDGSLALLESYRHGTFRWNDIEQKYSGDAVATLQVVDADLNGSWDIMLAGSDGVELLLTQIPESGEVLFKTSQEIADQPVGQLQLVDYDNDGLTDLVIAGGNGLSILHAEPGLQFSETDLLQKDVEGISNLVTADYDSDGDFDLAGISNGEVILLTNQGGNENAWLDVALLAARVVDKGASGSQRINHFGYGSLIEVRVGTQFQQEYVHSPVTRFGLGKNEQADAVRVIWTNGIPHNVIQPEVNQKIWEEQILLGSCPYLYTWNGEEFVFVTDLLWASPIGLKDPAGQLIPARPWEYLKISGDLLKPKDNKYLLQVTEELWEVAYFDKLELIAVDHPADVDVFTNEKVGPPFLAEHKIHQVKQKRVPVSVKNQTGHDLLPDVRTQDEVYAKPFSKKLTQGYTDESYLEIDFGLKENPESLKLFMTGWIFPTDAGLNAAIAEDPTRAGPAAPSIAVPNEDGQFVEVIPYCGFPGGKTKTIVIDLTDQFLTDDYRIRFSTSMELYWDHIFFSTETEETELVTQSLECLKADLHYRGVSSIESEINNGPHRFDYQNVSTFAAWDAIDGHFTRFGDVKELLTSSDDQLLVIGTGDEVTLEYAMPEKSLRAGWKRDFILHCVGWDKDANLHTVTGQTVGPLPYVQMKSYPDFENQPHPIEYLEKYQTRTMDINAFRDVLRRNTTAELD